VLSGAAETIRRFGPTAIVECNPPALRRFGRRTYRELAAAMKPLFSRIGTLDTAGRFVPLLSDRHLDLVLADRGVIDLVGLPTQSRSEAARAFGRALRGYTRLARTYNKRRPTENKVVDPVVDLDSALDAISGPPGTIVRVPTRVGNRTRVWFSSAFPYHPVHLAYRVLDGAGATVVADGHRTALDAPLAPGAAVSLDVTVVLPDAPGEYQVAITLVQEAFAWFDDLNPACRLLVPARVG
jgi:hypothetical protein